MVRPRDDRARLRADLDPRVLPLLPRDHLRRRDLPGRRDRHPDVRARPDRNLGAGHGPHLAPRAPLAPGRHRGDRRALALRALADARGDQLRLRAHRPGQGAARGRGALPARAPERAAPLRHDARAPDPGADRGERDLRNDLRVAGDRAARLRGHPGAGLSCRDRAELHCRAPHRRRHPPVRRPLHAGGSYGSACEPWHPRRVAGTPGLADLSPERPGSAGPGDRPRLLPDRPGRRRPDEGGAAGAGPPRGAPAGPAPGALRAAKPRVGARPELAAARRVPLRDRRAGARRLRADAGGRLRVALGGVRRRGPRGGHRDRRGRPRRATTGRCACAWGRSGS